MRRGWILAGVLILAAVPSVPMAATGVSMVVERMSRDDDGVGKWVRTGDVQRFRVRLNGMAKGARVAVAASPVEALSEVACVSSAGQASHPVPSPPAVGPAPLGSASVGPAPLGSASVGPPPLGPESASSAPFGPESGGPAPFGPESGGPAPFGSESGGPAPFGSESGSPAPFGPESGGLAAVGSETGVPAPSGLAPSGLATSGLATSGPMPSGPVAIGSGEGGLSTSAGAGAQSPAPSGPAATAVAPRALALPARALATRALAAMGTPAHPDGALLGVHVCRLGKVAGERSVDVTLTTPEGARRVVLAAVATMRSEPDDGLTTMRRTVAMRVIGTAPPIGGDAVKLADPSLPAAGRETGVAHTQTRRTAEAGAPDTQTRRTAEAGAPDLELTLPQATAQELPGVLQDGLGAVPTVGASPAPGTTPSPQIAGFSGTEAVPGAAPLPWEMAAATKPTRPTGQGNPLKGPMGHAMVIGGIGTLLGALWLIVTVQKRRTRRMVL
ncbi:hypothetical protein ACTWPT_16185 [Nonomuraea sp. 3N208]|uniref:hypothetical protein n=1 Tax=Nonomuraea sp. 3N208 TaxID=3457421 RepID=UPI003FCD9C75